MQKKYEDIFNEVVFNPNNVRTEKERIINTIILHSPQYDGYDRIHDPKHIKDFISIVPEFKFVTLDEAIQDSVSQLCTLTKEKEPILLLSGGIDSTLVFYALLSTGIPFGVMNDGGLSLEYQKLFQQLLNREFNNVTFYRSTSYSFAELINSKDVLFVTGEIGDQIAGSMVTMNFQYYERNMSLACAIRLDLLKKIYLFPYSGNFTKDCVEYYADILQWLNKTEDQCTVAEFLWAVNFVYKYMFVIYRLYICGMIQYGPEKNTYHFFDTDKFQQYAMSHYEENCAYKEPYEYKQPFKDWIYQQNGDLVYKKYKLKVPSLKLAQYWTNREHITR